MSSVYKTQKTQQQKNKKTKIKIAKKITQENNPIKISGRRLEKTYICIFQQRHKKMLNINSH
jgi:hypothetical protein